MKKRLILLYLLSTCSIQALLAQKAPSSVQTEFKKAFPTATAMKWSTEGKNFEADFTQGDTRMSAVFSPSGQLLETETPVTKEALPAGILTYIQAHYPGLPIHEMAQIKKKNGEINFEIGLHKKDILFDTRGIFIKEQKD